MEKTVKALVIIFVIVGIGLFGYHLFSQWHKTKIHQATEAERLKLYAQIAQLETEISRLTKALASQQQPQPSAAEIENVFGVSKPIAPPSSNDVDCRLIDKQVTAFFHYLDSKAYLIWPGIDMRAEALFKQVSKKLSAKPPVNVGELENLFNLLHNVTHLYRTLGKSDLDLLKEIFKSESAVLEPAMAVLFAWCTTCSNSADRPDLNTLYQYAHFFLNTLGGRSYLLRRDAKLRLLVTYYSLLVIDMANDAKLNAYGLDIRPHLDYVFYDINNQKGLMYHQRYVSQLRALQNKYQ